VTFDRKRNVTKYSHWYDEFGMTPRFLRIPLEEMKAHLETLGPPKIRLRQKSKSVEIVIQIAAPKRVYPKELERISSRRGVTLAKAFEDILWNKSSRHSTFWAEFVSAAEESYREAWFQFFKLKYLGHFHPVVDAGLRNARQRLFVPLRQIKRGRHSTAQAESDSLRRRYSALLPLCRLLHDNVRYAIAEVTKTGQCTRQRIRAMVWDRSMRSIHGTPGDGSIFDGSAFKRIPYGHAELHQPQSWKPHQLVIALISLERSRAYQTLEKKIVPSRALRSQRLKASRR
jgi:hypothetical protein